MNRLTAEEAVNGLQRVADMRMSRIKELEQQVADLLAALEREHSKRVGHRLDGRTPNGFEGCSVCVALAATKESPGAWPPQGSERGVRQMGSRPAERVTEVPSPDSLAKVQLEAHHEDADLGDDETCSVCGFHYLAAAHQGEGT